MNIKTIVLIRDKLKGFFSFNEKESVAQADVLLWCHDINRNYLYDGLRYSPIVDSLNERFINAGLSTITLARPYSEIPEKECYGNVCRVNGVIARAVFLDYIVRAISKVSNIFPESYFQILAWNKILVKINPSIIIGIEPIKELCVAAKNNDICTIDVQHGVQIDLTGKYAGHFYRLGYRAPRQQGWPDYVACWDRESAELLNKYRSDYTNAVALGQPWIIRFLLHQDKEDTLLNNLNSQYELKSDLPVILYSLQYSRDIDGNTDSFVRIPVELDHFIREHGDSYTWWLRVHPQLLRDEFVESTFHLLQELYSDYNNVNWYEVSYAPLPYVLSKTSLHLTRNSSVIKEASYFGIKSGLFDDESMHDKLLNQYGGLISQNKAEIMKGYNHIKEFIVRECSDSTYCCNNNEMLVDYERVLNSIIEIVEKSRS